MTILISLVFVLVSVSLLQVVAQDPSPAVGGPPNSFNSSFTGFLTCERSTITWNGGVAPYMLTWSSEGREIQTRLALTNRFDWLVNIGPGIPIVLKSVNIDGELIATSETFTTQPGSSSCALIAGDYSQKSLPGSLTSDAKPIGLKPLVIGVIVLGAVLGISIPIVVVLLVRRKGRRRRPVSVKSLDMLGDSNSAFPTDDDDANLPLIRTRGFSPPMGDSRYAGQPSSHRMTSPWDPTEQDDQVPQLPPNMAPRSTRGGYPPPSLETSFHRGFHAFEDPSSPTATDITTSSMYPAASWGGMLKSKQLSARPGHVSENKPSIHSHPGTATKGARAPFLGFTGDGLGPKTGG